MRRLLAALVVLASASAIAGPKGLPPKLAKAARDAFAAAQLAIDRPDAGYKPAALLRDYLETYPRGQFAKDAERLLGTVR